MTISSKLKPIKGSPKGLVYFLDEKFQCLNNDRKCGISVLLMWGRIVPKIDITCPACKGPMTRLPIRKRVFIMSEKTVKLRFCKKHKRLEGRHKGRSISFTSTQEAKDYALREGVRVSYTLTGSEAVLMGAIKHSTGESVNHANEGY